MIVNLPMQRLRTVFLLIVLMVMATGKVYVFAQSPALRINIPYAATLSPNLGMEVRLDSSVTLGVNVGVNFWDINKSKDRKWRHVMVSPSVRLWRDTAFHKGFLGIHAVYSHYNASNINFPLGFYRSIRDSRRQGDLYALGASLGYNWRLSNRWHTEAELGAALGYTHYKEYDCGHCGDYRGKYDKLFLLPKIALNVVYYIGSYREQPVTEPQPQPEPVKPLLMFHDVADNTGRAGLLEGDNPVLQHISKYQPYDRTRILRRDKGALYVHFPVDQSLLQADYRSNQDVLDRIVSITRQIMADSTSMVKKIQIIGLASIEGRVARNEQLGADRAEALKQYIQQRVSTPDSLYDLSNGGEAWAELRDQIAEAVSAAKAVTSASTVGSGFAAAELAAPAIAPAALEQALAVIDSQADLDRREQQLRRLDAGRTWQYISHHLLPDQRNSGYLRIYYDYVPDRAAAVINQASQLLQQQRYYEALALLDTVTDDQRALNARGVALWNTDRQAEALYCFRRAAANGNADAKENLRQLGQP